MLKSSDDGISYIAFLALWACPTSYILNQVLLYRMTEKKSRELVILILRYGLNELQRSIFIHIEHKNM
jgi:hypothetical protein